MPYFALVVQLDRAFGFEPKCCGFKSCREHQKNAKLRFYPKFCVFFSMIRTLHNFNLKYAATRSFPRLFSSGQSPRVRLKAARGVRSRYAFKLE